MPRPSSMGILSAVGDLDDPTVRRARVRSRCRTTAVAMLACVGLALNPADSRAQSAATLAPDGRWLPPLEDNLLVFRDGQGRDGSGPITRAQADAMLDVLAQVQAVLSRVPALDPPRGVEVRPSRQIGTMSAAAPASDFVHRTLLVQTFEPTLEIAVESDAAIEVHINAISFLLGAPHPPVAVDGDGPMFLEPPQLAGVAGLDAFGDGWSSQTAVVIRAHEGRPLWLPVSQERFIRARIRDMKARRDTMAADLRHGMAAADSVRNPELDELKKAIATMRTMDPEAARAMEEQMERMMAQLSRTPLPGEADLGPGVGMVDDQIAALEQELASLTPAERRSQAYFGPGGSRPSGLGAKGGVRRPVIAPNDDYFDRSVAPETTQLLVVVFRFMGTPPTVESELLERVRSELDWAALRKLVQ
jgi:hypothetical protein